MGARVRVDPRTGRLMLDLHVQGRRKRIFTALRDTARNRIILETKAEEIERQVFLGTFVLEKHFPRARTRPVTFEELYEEWRQKKATEVSPLTLSWYQERVERKILPTWGAKRLADFTPVLFDRFKASLLEQKLAPRTINIILMRFRELLGLGYDRGYLSEESQPGGDPRQGRPAGYPSAVL
jgi:hypothetical protein